MASNYDRLVADLTRAVERLHPDDRDTFALPDLPAITHFTDDYRDSTKVTSNPGEDSGGWEWKRADEIVLGDYLPFKWHRQDWLLEVVKVEPKRTRVWITVEEPTSGERWTTRPGLDEELRFKEAATLIDEAEARTVASTPSTKTKGVS